MAKKKKAGKVEMDPVQAAEFRRQQQILAKAELRRRVEEEAKNTKINGLKILKYVYAYAAVRSDSRH